MGDSAKFGDRSMTRKNKKGLKLGPAPVQETPNSLADKFETLELEAELKLGLTAEDLQIINELGAGNGGTVSKVMHKATKMVMARKVRLTFPPLLESPGGGSVSLIRHLRHFRLFA